MERLVVFVFGNPSSGKTSTAAHLKEMHGFEAIKTSDLVRQHASTRNLPLTSRRQHRQVYLDMVGEHGDDYVARRILDLPSSLVCVDGERIPRNVNLVRQAVGIEVVSVALWCPIEVRHERSLERGEKRDKVTLADFARDEAEEYQSHEPPYPSVMDTMLAADFHIDASGSLSETCIAVDDVLVPLL